MTSNGYNGNGRPVVTIYLSGNHVPPLFTLHTPEGPQRNLTYDGAANVLASYPVKPKLEFNEGNRKFPGGAKQFFRSAISGMPLPEALQEV